MKIKWTDWILIAAVILNWLSVAVGNRNWQSWTAAILLTATVILNYLTNRRAQARL